jgi:hypothetical protein
MQEPLVGLLQEFATCKRHLLSYDGLLAVSRLVTRLSVEDQFHKMAKLGSVLCDRSSVGHFLNRFRVFDGRFVVGAVHDD